MFALHVAIKLKETLIHTDEIRKIKQKLNLVLFNAGWWLGKHLL